MTYATHTELPSRRPGYTLPIHWLGADWKLTIGLDPNGHAKEVFIETPLCYAELASFASDTAILLSQWVLQREVRCAELSPSLSERPPSLLAVAIRAAEEVEREFGPGIAALYAEAQS